MFQPRIALCQLSALEDKVFLLPPVHNLDSDHLRLRDTLQD